MFSKRCFSDWCVQRVVRIRKGGGHQNASKQWCFQAFFPSLMGIPSVASPSQESEKHRLENTVWNPLDDRLAGNFGPAEKYLALSPLLPTDTFPAPECPCLPPLVLYFQRKLVPSCFASGSPSFSPLPNQKKKNTKISETSAK